MAKVSNKQLAVVLADMIAEGAPSTQLAKAVATLLVSQHRTRDLTGIMRALQREMARRDITEIHVETARPLTSAQKTKLANVFGARQATFHEVITDTVIGGVRATTLDAQFDATVHGKLGQLLKQINRQEA